MAPVTSRRWGRAHHSGKKDRRPAGTNCPVSPQAGYYRMFYKTDPADNGITEIVIAQPPAELDRLTQA